MVEGQVDKVHVPFSPPKTHTHTHEKRGENGTEKEIAQFHRFTPQRAATAGTRSDNFQKKSLDSYLAIFQI